MKKSTIEERIMASLLAQYQKLVDLEQAAIDPPPRPGSAAPRVRHLSAPECTVADRLEAKLQEELSAEERLAVLKGLHEVYASKIDGPALYRHGLAYGKEVERYGLKYTIAALEGLLGEGKDADTSE